MDRINSLLKSVNGNWKMGNVNRIIDLTRNLESDIAKANVSLELSEKRRREAETNAHDNFLDLAKSEGDIEKWEQAFETNDLDVAFAGYSANRNELVSAKVDLVKARELLGEALLVWNHDRSLTGGTHKRIMEFLYGDDTTEGHAKTERPGEK